MADSLSFTLRLIDKLTGPARKIRAALGGVSVDLQAARVSGDKADGINVDGATASVAKLGRAARGARADLASVAAAAAIKPASTAGTVAPAVPRGAAMPQWMTEAQGGYSKAVKGGTGLAMANPFTEASRAAEGLVSANRRVIGSWAAMRRSAAELGTSIRAKFGAALSASGLNFKKLGDVAGAAMRGIERGIFSVSKALLRWGTVGITAAGAAFAAFAAKVTHDFVDTAARVERLRKGMAALTGSVAGGQAAWKVSKALADRFGVSVLDTAEQMNSLLGAQFDVRGAAEIIKLGADLRSVGADAEGVKRAITAITQIKAKGKLQAEELVGQLSEAGVSTALVYKQLAKNLGKTEDQVRQLLQTGKIGADVGIEAIKGAIVAKVGETKLGQMGEQAGKTYLSGMIDRMKAAPSNFMVGLVESIESGPLVARFASMAQAITAAFSGDKLKASALNVIEKVTTGLENALPLVIKFFEGPTINGIANAIGEAIPLIAEFGRGIVAGLGELFKPQKGESPLETLTKNRAKFFEFGKAVVAVLGAVGSALRVAGDLIVWLSTSSAGKFTALGTVFGVVAARVVGLVGTLNSLGVLKFVGTLFTGLARAGSGLLGLFVRFLPTLIGFGSTIASVAGTAIAAVGSVVASVGLVPIAIGAALVAAAVSVWVYWDEIKAAFSAGWKWISDLASRWGTAAAAWGAALVHGVASGVKSALGAALDTVGSLGEGIADKFRAVLGIRSPSREFAKIGRQTVAGLQTGLDFSGAISAASAGAAAVTGAALAANDNAPGGAPGGARWGGLAVRSPAALAGPTAEPGAKHGHGGALAAHDRERQEPSRPLALRIVSDRARKAHPVNVTINLNVSGRAAEDPQAIARAVASEVRKQIDQTFADGPEFLGMVS